MKLPFRNWKKKVSINHKKSFNHILYINNIDPTLALNQQLTIQISCYFFSIMHEKVSFYFYFFSVFGLLVSKIYSCKTTINKQITCFTSLLILNWNILELKKKKNNFDRIGNFYLYSIYSNSILNFSDNYHIFDL